MEEKKRKLNEEGKRVLIEAVKKNPVIWDKTHPDHIKRNFLKIAWDNVAKEMDADVHLCKVAWKSIRDSERYHKIKHNKTFNSKERPRDVEYSYYSDNSTKPWEFSDEMKFLTEPTSPRLNYTSDVLATTPADNMSPDPSTSSYSYGSNTPISRRESCLNEPMFNVVEIVECKEEKIDDSFSNPLIPARVDYRNCSSELTNSTAVDISSDRCKSSFAWRKNTNEVAPKKLKTENSDNVPFLNHLDFLLQKLSIGSSESLQAKIIAMTYAEIAKQREQP